MPTGWVRKHIAHKLRWQLTFRFAGVTISTLLVIVLAVCAFLFFQLLVLNWRLSPESWIEIATRTAVPTTRRILQESPDNQQLISMWLNYVGSPTSYYRLLPLGQIEVTIRTIRSATALLLDATGVILGSSDSANDDLVGMEFVPDLLPGAGLPVQAALLGNDDPRALVSYLDGSNEFVVAVPISGDQPPQSRLLGVLVVKFANLPTTADVAAHTAVLTSISLLVLAIVGGSIAALFAFPMAKGLTDRLKRFYSIAGSWSKGDLTELISDARTDEVGELASRLDSMAQQMADLLKRREQIAIAEERNRVARDLHDSVKQQALAASFQIGTALSLVENDVAGARRHMGEADRLLNSVRSELSSLIDELYPTDGDPSDSADVLRDYIDNWSRERHVITATDVSLPPETPGKVRTTILRIVQEALSNVARHSGASHVSIVLTFSGAEYHLRISDDGCGFDQSSLRPGVGLRSMRERAASVAGLIDIESTPGDGTRVSVVIPERQAE